VTFYDAIKIGYRAEWKIHCLEGVFSRKGAGFISTASLAPLHDNEE
jgi:hypothetical protein